LLYFLFLYPLLSRKRPIKPFPNTAVYISCLTLQQSVFIHVEANHGVDRDERTVGATTSG
jgi:hypothetical protein